MSKQIGFSSFFVPPPAAKEGGVSIIPLRLPTGGIMELQVIGGGPIFLFGGSMSAPEAFALVNSLAASEERTPNYLLAGVKGQAAWRALAPRETDGMVTAFADIESIGHVRLCEGY